MKDNIPWKFKDLVLVTIIITFIGFSSFVIFALLSWLVFAVFKRDVISGFGFYFVGYAVYFSFVYFPLHVVKRYYYIGRDKLGIRKGLWSLKTSLRIGFLAGLLSVLVTITIKWIFFRFNIRIDSNFLINLFHGIFGVLSIQGFLFDVVGPIAEEVFWRGFLYGYLKSKCGVAVGLVIQALLFGLAHWGYPFPEAFGIQYIWGGFLLGFLYEWSDSLYPSMVCHSTLNYLCSILTVIFR